MPLFPKASLELVEVLVRHGTSEQARIRAFAAAEKAFDPKASREHSERDDPYVAYLFGNVNPLTASEQQVGDRSVPSFLELSVRVFGPLVEHVRTESAK